MSTITIADSLIRKITESWGDSNIVDPRTRYNDAPGFGWLSRRFGFYTTMDMRADGRHAPVYDNEFDLKAIRWAAWLMDATVPVAQTAKKRLLDYTISGGFDFTISHPSNRIEAIARSIVKSFLDNSRWCDLERQSFEAEFVDGEFMADFHCDGMDIAMEPLQGDQLQEPINTRDLEEWKQIAEDVSWSFGVVTKRNRNRPMFYHVVRNDACTDFDVVPANQFVHWKRNAPLSAKRGYSDLYLSHKIIKHGSTVLERTAIGSAIQASIAYIIEHAPGTTPRQIADFASQRANIVTKPNSLGQTERTREFGAGEIVETKSGQQYKAGLLGSNASDIYIQVMEACFRIAGTPYAFPEHFLTGYAGNNNLASSLTAQDPFVQGRLADQQVRAERFESLLRNVIRYGFKALRGRLNIDEDDIERIVRQFDIVVQKPEIISQQDNSALVGSLVTQIENKLIDRASAIQQLGYDIDTIDNGIAEDAEKAAKEQPTQPGQPGVAGALGQAGRRQFKNNRKAIDDITSELEAGTITPDKAGALLKELGLSPETIGVLLKQAEGVPEVDQGEPLPLTNQSRRKLLESFSGTVDLYRWTPPRQRRALLEELRGYGAPEEALQRLIEWDPSKHPNDPDGKYTPGGNVYPDKKTGDVLLRSKYGHIELVKTGDTNRFLARDKSGQSVGTFGTLNGAKQQLRKPKNPDHFRSGFMHPDVEWKDPSTKKAKKVADGKKPALTIQTVRVDPIDLSKEQVDEFGDNYQAAMDEFEAEDILPSMMKAKPSSVPSDPKTGFKIPVKGDPHYKDYQHLINYQLGAGIRAGGGNYSGSRDPKDYELAVVPISSLSRSQAMDDFVNDSSKAEAKHIGTWMGTGRPEDYAPAFVDASGVVLDGNHRLAARGMSKIPEMAVIRPKAGTYPPADTELVRFATDGAKFNGMTFGGGVPNKQVDIAVQGGPEKIAQLMAVTHPDDRAKLQAKIDARKSQAEASVPAPIKNPQASLPLDPKSAIPKPPQIGAATYQSYQKKLDAIHAAATAGDMKALEAIETNGTSKTYWTKKTHQYKQEVIAAMQGGKSAPGGPSPVVTQAAGKTFSDAQLKPSRTMDAVEAMGGSVKGQAADGSMLVEDSKGKQVVTTKAAVAKDFKKQAVLDPLSGDGMRQREQAWSSNVRESKAKIDPMGEDETKLWNELSGGKMSPATAIGALDNTDVYVSKTSVGGSPALMITSESDNVQVERTVYKKNGQLVMDNQKMMARGQAGAGRQMLKGQIAAAKALGVAKLTLLADGRGPNHKHYDPSEKLNGYYTWARYGYDGSVRGLSIESDIKRKFPQAERISDLMATPEGRDYWKKNGEIFNGTFDLTPGSRSMQTFTAYLVAKGEA